MLWAGRVISWVLVVTGGLTWTVGQAGLDSTDRNLCELASKIWQSPIENCHIVPALVLFWQIGIVAALAFLIFDRVRWLLSKRQTRHQRVQYFDRYLGVMQAILQIAERSAWGRWQDAQQGASGTEPHLQRKLHIAEHVLRSAAENGAVVVRARLKNSVEYSEIDRHFWRTAYIEIQPNKVSLWRAGLKARHGVTASIPAYDDLLVERDQIETIWPKRDWKLDWLTLRLTLSTKLKQMSGPKPTPETPQAIEAPDVATSPSAEARLEPPAQVSVTAEAPPNWERLFAIGDEGKSVWLRFLPDTKDEKADTLLLIVYGHKVLLANTRVGIHSAYAAVQKTISVSPSKSYASLSALARMSFFSGTVLDNEDYASKHLGSSLKRVGLSQGGMYELTEYGHRLAHGLANDLISRA